MDIMRGRANHRHMSTVVRPSGLLGCALAVALCVLGTVAVALTAARLQASHSQALRNLSFPVIDELNGTSLGDASGITFVTAINGTGVRFRRVEESRIQYPFIPSQGTLEWWINVGSGYRYVDNALYSNEPSALIFTSDCQGGDVTWPGSTWFFLGSDGTLSLVMATTKYDGPRQILKAEKTSFRFNEWHSIGISFGSEGQFMMLDGNLVAQAPGNNQKLGRGGDHDNAIDVPTVGESVSGFWTNNRYDGGFDGVVDRFRISNVQRDWQLAVDRPH